MEVLFGGSSSENLRIKDSKKRTEIFDYFKNNIPNALFSTEKYSKLKAGKKPLIAIAVLLILFCGHFIMQWRLNKEMVTKLRGA